MKILRNYLLREFAGPFLLTLSSLTFIMVLVGNLNRIMELVMNKGVDLFSVLKLFVLLIPYIVTYALPISVLIAILLALGRLSGDNEIIAIRSSGISVLSLIKPLLITGLVLSFILVLFNDRAASYAHFAYRKTLKEIAYDKTVIVESVEHVEESLKTLKQLLA